MADVPLRTQAGGATWPARWAEIRAHLRPLVIIAGSSSCSSALAGSRARRSAPTARTRADRADADTTPVRLTIGAETLSIPANMLRFAAARAGGLADHADLALLWPGLDGYSDENAAAFMEEAVSPNVIYATIAPRESALDSTGRLDPIYARLFVGKPMPGPAGLVGRALGPDSGYDGEIVYFSPEGPAPFVARCPATTDPNVPRPASATSISGAR